MFDLRLWHSDCYLDPAAPGPSRLISLADVLSPAIRHTITIHGQRAWITMPVRK